MDMILEEHVGVADASFLTR